MINIIGWLLVALNLAVGNYWVAIMVCAILVMTMHDD